MYGNLIDPKLPLSQRYRLNNIAVSPLLSHHPGQSSLAYLFYAFSRLTSLTTTYTDVTWVLPVGVPGIVTFCHDTCLVGGNGMMYRSNEYGYARMVMRSFLYADLNSLASLVLIRSLS